MTRLLRDARCDLRIFCDVPSQQRGESSSTRQRDPVFQNVFRQFRRRFAESLPNGAPDLLDLLDPDRPALVSRERQRLGQPRSGIQPADGNWGLGLFCFEQL